jgi:phage shock protein A
MGILERFATIMRANINALLDKCEDPSKMIDQYLIDLKESLAEVKTETAGVIAIEKNCARQFDENEKEIKKYQDLSKKAANASADDDATVFIKKYKELESKRPTLESNKNAAAENAAHIRSMHDKLVDDIRILEGRKAQIKSAAAVAKTTDIITKIGDPSDKASRIGGKFDDMEAKANRMLDEAKARSELNAPSKSAAEELSKKYAVADDAEIKAELNRLKGK